MHSVSREALARQERKLAFGRTLTEIRALPETRHPGVRYWAGCSPRPRRHGF